MLVERHVIGAGRRREAVDTGVVDQDVGGSGFTGQPANIIGGGQVGGDETGFPPPFSISRTASDPRSLLRPCTTTRPMPDVAPVTNAVRWSAISALPLRHVREEPTQSLGHGGMGKHGIA